MNNLVTFEMGNTYIDIDMDKPVFQPQGKAVLAVDMLLGTTEVDKYNFNIILIGGYSLQTNKDGMIKVLKAMNDYRNK